MSRIPHLEPSLTLGVYKALKRDIIECLFKPGESLHENTLAEKYKVSKTPVREALNMLRHEGYVQAQARRGYLVWPISLKDVQDVFQLRLMVEPPAAALAAERIDEPQLRQLRKLSEIKYVHGDRQSYPRFLAANRDFHTAVAKASGNQRLAEVVERLLEEMERFFHLGLDVRDSSGEMVHEHHDLVDALVAGDSQLSEKIMREQIMVSRKRVIEALISEPSAMAASTLQVK